jgi:hypothetical protein
LPAWRWPAPNSTAAPDAERIYRELPKFLLDAVGDVVVTVMYGALSNIHPDLWYKPMCVGTKWFDRFLIESVEKGIVGPGEADLVVTLPVGIEITLCHEKDVHVRADTVEVIESLISSALFRAFVGDVSFAKRG